MTSMTLSTRENALFAHLRCPNERAVFVLGLSAFLLVVTTSIAARAYLESRFAMVNGFSSANASKGRLLVKGDILVPVTLSVKLADGRAVLRGVLPTEKAHQTVLARARDIYGLTNIDYNLGVQPDIVVTPWFDSVLKWFPPKLTELRTGEISVSGMNVLLSGQVSTSEARYAADRMFAKLVGPEGHVVNELQVRYSAESATAPASRNVGAANKTPNRLVKPATFKVQF